MVSKSRVLLIPAVALLLALSLAACGGDGEETAPGRETPGASSSGGTVTIDFWHAENAANQDTLQRLASQFNASQTEVRVRLSYQGKDEELLAKLMASLSSGQLPAVVFVPDVNAQMMIDSGAVTPVEDFADREGYDLSNLDEKSIREYTTQGKVWALPLGAGIPLLYYNKVVFREVGLDPERPPQDLEEVREYSEKILKRDSSGQVVRSGLAIDVQDWIEHVLAEHGDLLADNNNGYDGRATKVLFDNDTGLYFFQWWHDMVDEGLAFNVGRNPTFVDGFMAMASGRAAMTFSYASALRSVLDVVEQGVEGVEIGVGKLPGLPGDTGTPLLNNRGLWIISLRPEEEQEAAWKFLKWLMGPEQQAGWSVGSGYLPANHAALDQPVVKDMIAKYPLFEVPLDQYLNSPVTTASLTALIGPFWQVREAVHQGEERMLSGAQDPEQALEDAAADANRIIEEYNQKMGD